MRGKSKSPAGVNGGASYRNRRHINALSLTRVHLDRASGQKEVAPPRVNDGAGTSRGYVVNLRLRAEASGNKRPTFGAVPAASGYRQRSAALHPASAILPPRAGRVLPHIINDSLAIFPRT